LKNYCQFFFEENPEGKIVVILQNEVMERELSFIRNGFLLEHYDLNEFKEYISSGNSILRNWHSVSPSQILNLNLSIFESFYFPYIQAVNFGPVGLNFLLLFSSEIESKVEPFPVDWAQWISSSTTFAGEEVDVKKYLKVLI
jgi:hypothetical protein